MNLDLDEILACRLINKSCKAIVDNLMFWLKKWRLRGLSKESYKDWINAIQMTRNTKVEKYVDLYINKIIRKNYHNVDVPCYIDKSVLERFSKIVDDHGMNYSQNFSQNYSFENAFWEAVHEGNAGILQFLAPLMGNPNLNHCTSSNIGVCKVSPEETPINYAARRGHENIIKALAPLIKYPNLGYFGRTPMHDAAIYGQVNVIKLLGPLTKHTNSTCNALYTIPIRSAAISGHLNVIKFLAP